MRAIDRCLRVTLIACLTAAAAPRVGAQSALSADLRGKIDSINACEPGMIGRGHGHDAEGGEVVGQLQLRVRFPARTRRLRTLRDLVAQSPAITSPRSHPRW